VKVAIKKAKLGKAPGPSGIVSKVLKAAGDVSIQRLMTDLCYAMVLEGNISRGFEDKLYGMYTRVIQG
jgi:hypothetical protein